MAVYDSSIDNSPITRVVLTDSSGQPTATSASSGGTSSSFGSAVPSTGTASGFSDGTNMQAGRVFDADSGAGTQYVQGVQLRKSASGGSVELGTTSDPMVIGGAVADAGTDSGNPLKVGGIYESTPATYTNGQRANLHTGTRGSLAVQLMLPDSVSTPSYAASNADAVASGSTNTRPQTVSLGFIYNGTTFDRTRSSTVGTGILQVSEEHSFSNISTNATTTVKSGAGILHSLVINTRGATTTATVYDNTAGSGTKIGTIDTTLSTTSFTYDLKFSTGLTIVTAGTTPADITVTYR